MWEQMAQMGGGLVSAGMSYLGQREANSANRDIARDQMGFQRDMSNTSYQRGMKDLQAAGLNPLLMSPTGASTPQGAGANMENTASGAVNSAMDAFQLAQAVKKSEQEISNLQKSNNLLSAQEGETRMRTKVMSKGIPEADAKNMIWDKVKPVVEKVSKALSTDSRSLKQRNEDTMRDFRSLIKRKP